MASENSIEWAARVAANLEVIRDRCHAAAYRVGRQVDDVRLMVVSKTWPAEVVAHAVTAGQVLFGENRVQEALGKAPALPAELEWHLIGPLQRNKIRKALPLFRALHGIDSLKLAEAVDRVAAEMRMRPQLFLEVNIGAETSKHGFLPDQLRAEYLALAALDHIEIVGLMAIPPAVKEPEMARPYFHALRQLRDDLETEHEVSLPQLSMGMSSDFEVAIEEGSTLVRVGSAIFGPRLPKV